MKKHVIRNQRAKLFKVLTKQPQAVELRVIGREAGGFKLGGAINGNLILFSQVFEKQKDAIAYGEQKFAQKAKKLLASVST